jgi:hypothetical protein
MTPYMRVMGGSSWYKPVLGLCCFTLGVLHQYEDDGSGKGGARSLDGGGYGDMEIIYLCGGRANAILVASNWDSRALMTRLERHNRRAGFW